MANRHLLRTVALQSLFEWDFNHGQENLEEITERMLEEFASGAEDADFAKELIKGVIDNQEEIDRTITETAPEWPLDQITNVDRNVLRLGIYELMFTKETPPKVAINEAVEMGKRFGGESSGKFVNGVLGTLYKKMFPNQEPEESIAKEETAD
jgi:transcription antitermination protein NusB